MMSCAEPVIGEASVIRGYFDGARWLVKCSAPMHEQEFPELRV